MLPLNHMRAPINLEQLNNENLRLISGELILSNSGEAIVISKDYTKGLILKRLQ